MSIVNFAQASLMNGVDIENVISDKKLWEHPVISPDMKFIEYGMNKISIIFTCRDQKELTLVLLHAGISCLLSTDDITNPSGDKHSLFIDV